MKFNKSAPKSKSPDGAFSQAAVRRLAPLEKPAYLTGLGATAAAAGVFLTFLWLFFTTFVVPVAGAVESTLGASAANIIGTATAVASKVIAIFFMVSISFGGL